MTDTTDLDAFPHTATCANPRLRIYTGALGDTMGRCFTCGRGGVVAARDRDAPQPYRGVSEPVDPTLAAGRWRCREHPDVAVTWRGNGCRQCQQATTERTAS